jgi:trans-2,3-dihydro-3-hydroxyanthranilate isomerase
MPRPCLVIRVFTRDGSGGNHLGVINDVTGLDDEMMQAIAADLGFSETIFIDWREGGVPVTRIFTPTMEMPFAGHPLVGAAWVMLRVGPGDIDGLRCGIGDVKIRVEGDVAWVDAPMVPANAHLDDDSFAARVHLPTPRRAWRVEMPLDYRMVELPAADDVASVAPDTSAFGSVDGLTVFARDGERIRMRFFIPTAGIDEDPATGSAAVALATMFAADGETEGRVTIDQGEEMGHPSRINLRWSGTTASIGGTVAHDELRELTQ